MNNRHPIQLNAELVKNARTTYAHTQESLSNALKVSRKTISSIENGNKTETHVAEKIAKELDVTLNYLMGQEEPILHYWIQIYEGDKNGEFVSINKLGTVFENSCDLIDFIDNQVFSSAPQYVAELPRIVSSYYLDKATNAILASVSYGESKNIEQFKIEVKLIKLTNAGLTWSALTEFNYYWVELSLKELLYKRSTFVNPLISIEPIKHMYQIHIEQVPSKTEEFEVIKSLNKYQSIDEDTLAEKYQYEWRQLTLSFIKYEPIEINTFNDLFRAIQLVLNEYNPSKLSTAQCNFNSNNHVQFDALPNIKSDKTRGLRLKVRRVESNKYSTNCAPWPEFQMREIEKLGSIYADATYNQFTSNVLTNEIINEIKNCL